MKLKVEAASGTSSESDRWKAWAALFLIGGLFSSVYFGLMLLLSVSDSMFPNAEGHYGRLGAMMILWAAGLVLSVFVILKSLQWYRHADAVEDNERSE